MSKSKRARSASGGGRVAELPTQRRPKWDGDWIITERFLDRLNGVLRDRDNPSANDPGKMTYEELAALLKKSGYPVDKGTITNVRNRIQATSKFVGPICWLFSWPEPPPAGTPADMVEFIERINEARFNNPALYEKIQEVVNREYENWLALSS